MPASNRLRPLAAKAASLPILAFLLTSVPAAAQGLVREPVFSAAIASTYAPEPRLALALPAPVALADASAATLPDAPSAVLLSRDAGSAATAVESSSSVSDATETMQPADDDPAAPAQNAVCTRDCQYDAQGRLIPLERQQPKRILGFMPNFRSVSGGAKAHPPGWRYNFNVATHQAFDYSTFVFLGLTTISAEGLDEHRSLGKGVEGFWNYGWRGFLDKTDGTYLQAWLLASALHEDTRFYALGNEHSIPVRALYVISRQAVARTYGGHQTPNIAGLGGKVLTQVISRNYYPQGSTDFATLATKFGYSVMRDIAFSSIREFYPDAAAHYIRKHREKMARLNAARASASDASTATANAH